ncbi:UDP-N-acetylmuramoyl-L-alanine--D-glutamate ligase [Hydrogenophaga sp.]|uniref:UDP-N-acetylmuramoyl-L-alanine--D-glutamate ligase n=1 Tax=Hydrogenophaga sp. TaxID=1904254 RepID=UPI0035B2CB0F
MNLLNDQHVLVLGLGISGLSMARWCVRQGARVTVADTRENPPSLAALRAECPSVAFVAGPFDDGLLARERWQMIARSPGLPPEQLLTARAWAQSHGAALVGELDLFAQALEALARRETLPYRPQVLAITGTNGKTTVTSLTGLLLQRAGLRVAVAGNIGPALLDVLSGSLDAEREGNERDAACEAADAQDGEVAAPTTAEPASESDDLSPEADAVDDLPEEDAAAQPQLVPPPPPPPQPPHLPQVWVLELSSFQLDGTAGGAWDSVPTAGTVLNITEDHLDWHGSMAAYAGAKQAVFGTQALMVLNREDPAVVAMTPGQVTVKIGGRNRQQPARPWTSFGLDMPLRAGDWGIEAVNGMEWLVRALPQDETRQRGRGSDAEDEVYYQRLMPVDALRIRGRHNAANALAALALATSTGAALAPMLHGLREYRGEPHRVEPIGILDDVEYFDDSKGTNVGATLAAIRGLGSDRRLVVILGGDGKGQDFAPLAEPLARHARAVVLIGRDGPKIREQVASALEVAGIPLRDAAAMPEAVAIAAQEARAGDAVLMSPACASLDMFRDYKHRADVFIAAVRALADERGVSLEGAL